MIIHNLKNYQIYKQKILKYAKAINIKIEFKEEDYEGLYIPARSKIRIDDVLEQTEEIATLLHELGHALDDKLDENAFPPSVEKAYSRVYRGKPSQLQLDKVLDCEKRAWDLGRVIAKKLKIKLGKWYDKEESSALKNYRCTETK